MSAHAVRAASAPSGAGRFRRSVGVRRGGFTLIEALITISIIAILMAILAPALQATLGLARGFQCKMSLRTIAFDFRVFADDDLYADRGQDSLRQSKRFRLETFLNAEYGTGEFWSHGDEDVVPLEETRAYEVFQDPEVDDSVQLHRGHSASEGGVKPWSAVSYGFNRNLHRRTTIHARGRSSVPNSLTGGKTFLDEPGVPLVLDVDGRAAQKRGLTPLYTAPDPYRLAADDPGEFWFPALRHNRQANIAFLDGHVINTPAPLEAPAVRWDYQPE